MKRIRLVAALAATALAACADEEAVMPPADQQARVPQRAYPPHWITRYGPKLKLAEKIPGFVGYDRRGDMVTIYVQRPETQAQAAREAWRTTAAIAGPNRFSHQVQVAKGKYLFTELIRFNERIGEIAEPDGDIRIWGIDVTTVLIWVRPETDMVQLRARIERAGVPWDAMSVKVGEIVTSGGKIEEMADYPVHWWNMYRRDLELLQQIPGYAGSYLEGEQDQIFVVLLEDPATQAERARYVLASKVPPAMWSIPEAVCVRPAKYGMIDLIRWREIILENVRRLAKTVQINGVRLAENDIYFGVLPGTDRSALKEEIQALGIPLDAVVIDFAGPLDTGI